MFSVMFRENPTQIAAISNVQKRLDERVEVTPEDFTETLNRREKTYTNYDYTPTAPLTLLRPGTYYLTGVDALERRSYARRYHTMIRRGGTQPQARVVPRLQTGTAPRSPLARVAPRLLRFLRFARR